MLDVAAALCAEAVAMHITLTYPRFGRLLAALSSSQLGDWLYNVALLAAVEQRTHSPAWLGVTTAARIGPMVVCGPLGGVLADRLDRRRLMIAADAVRAGLMGLLAVGVVTGAPVVCVPVLAGLATMVATVYPPCVAAVTPRLVAGDDLAAANAARAMIAPAAVAAGPVLGGLLLVFASPGAVIALNGVTFLVSAALVLSIRGGTEFAAVAAEGERSHAADVFADLRAGARALRAVPAAAQLVSGDVAASFAYGAQTVLLLLLAGRLGLGADGYGYLLAAQGAGGIIGAAVGGRIAGRESGQRLAQVIALSLVAAPIALLSLTTALVPALVLGVIAGAGALMLEVIVETQLQRTLDERRIGSAYGFAFAASVAGIAVGSLLAPVLVSLAGLTGALLMIAAVVAGLAVVLQLRRKAVDPRVVVQ